MYLVADRIKRVLSRARIGCLDNTRGLKSLSKFWNRKVDLEEVKLDGFYIELGS